MTLTCLSVCKDEMGVTVRGHQWHSTNTADGSAQYQFQKVCLKLHKKAGFFFFLQSSNIPVIVSADLSHMLYLPPRKGEFRSDRPDLSNFYAVW